MKPAFLNRFSERGVTFIELLIVITIIGLFFIPLLSTYNTSRASRALDASIHELANNTRSVHVFAREAKDASNWGIRSNSNSGYELVSGEAGDYEVVQRYSLESGVLFVDSFEVWFGIATGETPEEVFITLENTTGAKGGIRILPTGVVEEIMRL